MAGFGLTSADIAELEQMVGDVKAELEQPVQQQEAAPAQETAAEYPDRQETAQPERTVEAKPEEESIRPVPYNRFKEVNAERATLRAERDAMANELAELRAKSEAMAAVEREAKPAAQQKSWVERVLDGDDDNEAGKQQAPEQVPAWAKPMMTTLESIQQERQMAELDRVVSGIQRDYPDMPEEVVLSGIAAGQSVHDIAVAWDRVGRAYAQAHGFVPRESAPAAQAAQQRTADIAPRLSASKGQMNAPEPKSWVQGWGKSHQSAVADFIKTQG